MAQLEIVLMNATGRTRRVVTATDAAAVELLKSTYFSEAPISITYRDGSAVEGDFIARLNQRIYPKTKGRAQAAWRDLSSQVRIPSQISRRLRKKITRKITVFEPDGHPKRHPSAPLLEDNQAKPVLAA